MKYKHYPTHKDSGIDWLGKVPAHWDLVRFRFMFFESKERNGSTPVGNMLSVSGYRGIEEKEYEHEGKKRTDEELESYRVVRPNQLAVNTMWLNHCGLGVSSLTGHVSPAYSVYDITSELNPAYAHHLLRSDAYVDGYKTYLYGIRPNSFQIKDDDFRSIPVLVPSTAEQQSIAKFLDRETTRIDALIEKKQRLIELLKEKRQAVITQAVTKGLDPNVPMKDSGVEWLGEVPGHWDVVRVKHVSSFCTSGSRGWGEFISDDGDIFLQSGDLTDEMGVNFDDAPRVDLPHGAEGIRTRVNYGDVIVCITGAKTGRVGYVDGVPSVAYVNQHLALIRPVNLSVTGQWLGINLLSEVGQISFQLNQYGLKEGLSLGNVLNAPVVKPPLTEQVEITEYIQQATASIDALIKKTDHSIELMREHHSALITAAVTGQIDVRNVS